MKIEYYRQQATQLRKMAQREPEGPDRDKLLHLAAQYDRLAEEATAIK